MKVKIIDHTQNPIETIYRAFRICYSADIPTNIKIPTNTPNCISYETSGEYKMLKFIKSHISHGSPLEHVSFTFAIEGISRACSHQLVRHRLASYSQQSQRYVKLEQFEYVIPPEIEKIPEAKSIFLKSMYKNQLAYDQIHNILKEHGRNKEQCSEDARYVFPNACCTNIIMTMNVRELIHFLGERLCKHAQWEIRELAGLMLREADGVLPLFDMNDVIKCGKSCFECTKEVN